MSARVVIGHSSKEVIHYVVGPTCIDNVCVIIAINVQWQGPSMLLPLVNKLTSRFFLLFISLLIKSMKKEHQYL